MNLSGISQVAGDFTQVHLEKEQDKNLKKEEEKVSGKNDLVMGYLADVLNGQISEAEKKVRWNRFYSLPLGLVNGIHNAHTAVQSKREELRGLERGDGFTLSVFLAISEQKLQEHIRAIRRFILGTWGSCLTCGEFIGLEQLKAHPTAEECSNCRKLEKPTANRGTKRHSRRR